MAERPGWCVSLFMPTHRSGEKTRQDPILLQNILRQAEEKLIEKGMRTIDARTLLEPAHNLEGYSPFWRHLNDGLAMYIAQGVFRYYTLPLAFETQLIIAEHFYIKPLLPLLSGDRRFYLLPLYQSVNSYPHLLEASITGNPEQFTEPQLHKCAWKIVQPHFYKAQQDECASFVALGEQCWGSYDPHAHLVNLHDNPQPGDEDLLQFACNHAILNGGNVFSVEKNEMPGEGLLATVFRY